MKRPKFERLDLNEAAVNEYIELLEHFKKPYRMTLTNYTTKIESEVINAYFLKTMQSISVFTAGAMLKKELTGYPLPLVNMEANKYYDTNFQGTSFYADKVYNIDIKSAYATILYKDGFITGRLYKKLCRLPKKDRLAAVGMIAGRKYVVDIDSDGNYINDFEEVNPLAPFFFYAVQKTEHIIAELRNEVFIDSFLFSWVDGLYFNREESNGLLTKIACDRIREKYGLETTVSVLTDFEVNTKNGFYQISFHDGERKKFFCIPLPETRLKKFYYSYLLKSKPKTNVRKNSAKQNPDR